MNPHSAKATGLVSLFRSVADNRQLIVQMIRREVVGRYRGSVLGIFWSLFNPLFMLAVYTFVFSVVFKSRWGDASAGDNKTQFAVLLFAGMIVHSLLAEVLNRAPYLIPGNVNYVKKVMFPLEVLPIVALGSTLFHAVVSLLVLLVAFVLFNGFMHWTVLLIPIVWFPLLLATLGFAWMLASLGVFLRDVGQLIGIITTVLLFLAPVFYPLSAIPQKFQFWILLNPITFMIEQTRQVVIWGKMPNWSGLGVYFLCSLVVLWVGFWWFQKTRKGFADVL